MFFAIVPGPSTVLTVALVLPHLAPLGATYMLMPQHAVTIRSPTALGNAFQRYITIATEIDKALQDNTGGGLARQECSGYPHWKCTYSSLNHVSYIYITWTTFVSLAEGMACVAILQSVVLYPLAIADEGK